jgi:hypothetical protein
MQECLFPPNIFTSLPLVHTLNPDFLGLQLWLCFSRGSWMSSPEIPELGLRRIPQVTLVSQLVRACPCAWVPNRVFTKFPNQQFFRSSAYQQLRFRAPACSWLLLLSNQDSRTLHIREFETSQVQASKNREFPAPEKHALRTSLNSTFRGWRVFLNSPTVPSF